MTGGIGKTTIAIHLAISLAKRGQRVLLLDLDPQGGVDLFFASGRLVGLADYLMDRVPIGHALKRTPVENLRLLGRGKLDPVDWPRYEAAVGSSAALRQLLDLVSSRFDFVIMDLPCGLGSITRAALACADQVLAPVVAEPLPVRAISQTCRVIDWIRSSENPRLDLLGLLPVMLDPDSMPGDSAVRSIWFGFASNLDVAIPRSPQLVESSRRRRPLHMLPNSSPVLLQRFEALADEVLRRAVTADGERANVEVVLERLRTCAPSTDAINDEFAPFQAQSDGGAKAEAVAQATRAVEAAANVLQRLCADENFGFRSWTELIDWCLQVTGCHDAFAMDHQGLLIADSGKMQAEQVADTGTRLMLALDHARKMTIADNRAQAMSIQLGNRWLTGIRIGDGDGAFTVGLLGNAPVGPDQRKTIEDVLGIVAERYYTFSAAP